jgi:hypothetical protein
MVFTSLLVDLFDSRHNFRTGPIGVFNQIMFCQIMATSVFLAAVRALELDECAFVYHFVMMPQYMQLYEALWA